MPKYIVNHGILKSKDLYGLLRQSKVFFLQLENAIVEHNLNV